MSLRVLHLTAIWGGLSTTRKIAISADKIIAVREPYREEDKRTFVFVGGGEDDCFVVSEPYDQVLRMWSDALADNSV